MLIGPGVGTLGAAILGGLRGNAHAKQKEREREERRALREMDRGGGRSRSWGGREKREDW